MNKIIIICGPSGVGKGTIIQKLILDKSLNLIVIPTITTRKPSKRDNNTNNYKFITKDNFFEKSKKGDFIETNYYDNNYYATSKKDILNILNSNSNAIKEQDISTALKTKKLFPENIIVVFIDSPLEVIKNRLQKRSENSPIQVQRRLNHAKKELALKNKADYIVNNPENFPEKAVEEIKNIIIS